MKKNIFYLLFLSTVLFSACSTELDVVGKYKETLVVYGLLDQSQAVQYIKINKAFLGEGNAYTYAQIKDSTQFVNALNVKITRLSDGVVFPLTPYNLISKPMGTFYSPDQTNVIYSFVSKSASYEQLGEFNEKKGGFDYLKVNDIHGNPIIYKLTVQNNETGIEVSSQTTLLSDATITNPSVGAANSVFAFVTVANPNPNFTVAWTSGANARLYQMVIRFNYLDSTVLGNTHKYIDWVFPTQTTLSLAGGDQMSEEFKGQSFLQFIGNQLGALPVSTDLKARRALKTEIILVSGADDLNTYMEVNAPSTGIVQEKPAYTNVTNGLGIFSSRFNKAPFGKFLSSATLNELACGQYTHTLLFENANGVICP